MIFIFDSIKFIIILSWAEEKEVYRSRYRRESPTVLQSCRRPNPWWEGMHLLLGFNVKGDHHLLARIMLSTEWRRVNGIQSSNKTLTKLSLWELCKIKFTTWLSRYSIILSKSFLLQSHNSLHLSSANDLQNRMHAHPKSLKK